MRLVIVYEDYETNIEKIDVLENENITFKFVKLEKEYGLENYLIIETEEGDISIKIESDFYKIRNHFFAEETIKEKLLSDKNIKLIVCNYSGVDTLAEII